MLKKILQILCLNNNDDELMSVVDMIIHAIDEYPEFWRANDGIMFLYAEPTKTLDMPEKPSHLLSFTINDHGDWAMIWVAGTMHTVRNYWELRKLRRAYTEYIQFQTMLILNIVDDKAHQIDQQEEESDEVVN